MIAIASRGGVAQARDPAEQMLAALRSSALRDYCREQLRDSVTPEEHRATVTMIAEIVGASR